MIESLKKTAQSAVSALQAAGADKAQANVSYTITHEFNVDGGEFSLFRTLFDKQLAMTAIQGGKKGTVAQNRYDEETIAASAREFMERSHERLIAYFIPSVPRKVSLHKPLAFLSHCSSRHAYKG